jgi:hypothetical protein
MGLAVIVGWREGGEGGEATAVISGLKGEEDTEATQNVRPKQASGSVLMESVSDGFGIR